MFALAPNASPDPMLDLGVLAPAAIDIVQDHSNSKLKRFLESVLSDRPTFARVAKHSHRHQLGFIKLAIPLDNSAGYLRIHIWDQLVPIQEDIHSHCALFQSRVVLGALRENSFSLSNGDSHTLFRYRFDTDAGHAVATANGMTGVKATKSNLLQAGDVYTKNPNQLHNVSEAAIGTVTVSAWGPRSIEALVLKPLGALAEDCVAAVGISADELIFIVQSTLKRLSNK